MAGRFTPGTFTNYITRKFAEPRLIIVADPRLDAQAIKEASYVNIPVIALCDTDSPLEHVDIAIPCNNKGRASIGLIWWMLAREVLRLRGTIPSREAEWAVMPDLFFYRDPEAEEAKAEEEGKTVEDVGAAAIDAGNMAGNGDWEVAGANSTAFAGAQSTEWAASAEGGAEWAAAPAEGATAEWGAAETTQNW